MTIYKNQIRFQKPISGFWIVQFGQFLFLSFKINLRCCYHSLIFLSINTQPTGSAKKNTAIHLIQGKYCCLKVLKVKKSQSTSRLNQGSFIVRSRLSFWWQFLNDSATSESTILYSGYLSAQDSISSLVANYPGSLAELPL